MIFPAPYSCERLPSLVHPQLLGQESSSLKLSFQAAASTCDYRLQSLPSQGRPKMTLWSPSQPSLKAVRVSCTLLSLCLLPHPLPLDVLLGNLPVGQINETTITGLWGLPHLEDLFKILLERQGGV